MRRKSWRDSIVWGSKPVVGRKRRLDEKKWGGGLVSWVGGWAGGWVALTVHEIDDQDRDIAEVRTAGTEVGERLVACFEYE